VIYLVDSAVHLRGSHTVQFYLLVLTNTALLFILEKASLLNIPLKEEKKTEIVPSKPKHD